MRGTKVKQLRAIHSALPKAERLVYNFRRFKKDYVRGTGPFESKNINQLTTN